MFSKNEKFIVITFVKRNKHKRKYKMLWCFKKKEQGTVLCFFLKGILDYSK